MNYSKVIADEVSQDLKVSADRLLALTQKVCDNELTDIDRVLTCFNSLTDGEEVSDLCGVDKNICGASAKLIRDAFTVPVVLQALMRQGAYIATPVKSQAEVDALVAAGATVITTNQQPPIKDDFDYWNNQLFTKEQLEGLISFQTATDNKSAYGLLILNLANAVLHKMRIQKPGL